MRWRDLRELVLGETWELPAGITLLVVVGLVLEATAGGWWRAGGGFVLLALVAVVLVGAVARAGRR